MKPSLTLMLAALLLANSGRLAAQQQADPKPGQPPLGGVALPGFQPPGGGGLGGPPGGFGLPGQANHKELVAALIENLDDADAEVRQAIATALGKIGRQAVSPLLGILKDKEKAMPLRASAAHALGEVGSQAQEALPELTKALKEKDKDLRKNAAYAIGKIVQTGGFGSGGGFPFPMGPGGIGGPGVGGPGGGPGLKPLEPIKPIDPTKDK